MQNEDGTVTVFIKLKERTYDLKSREQGRMIQVSIPATVPLRKFDYNTEVDYYQPDCKYSSECNISWNRFRLVYQVRQHCVKG